MSIAVHPIDLPATAPARVRRVPAGPFAPGPLERDLEAILGIVAARDDPAPVAQLRRNGWSRAVAPGAVLLVAASIGAGLWVRSPHAPSADGRPSARAAMAIADPVSRSLPGDSVTVAAPHRQRIPIDPPIPPAARQLAAAEPIAKAAPAAPEEERDTAPKAKAKARSSPVRRAEWRPARETVPAETRLADGPDGAAGPAGRGGDDAGSAPSSTEIAGLALAGDRSGTGAQALPALAVPPVDEVRQGRKTRVQRSIDAIKLLRRQ